MKKQFKKDKKIISENKLIITNWNKAKKSTKTLAFKKEYNTKVWT